ncbi:MAG: YcaO-like family protein [Sneathiella sp.]
MIGWEKAHDLLTSIAKAESVVIRYLRWDADYLAALEFLEFIGYITISEEGQTASLSETNEAELENQLALLSLAGKCQDLFILRSPEAENIWFFGAALSLSAFGIDHHPQTAQGTGGKSLDPRASFEGCIGEAAEYLSFLQRKDDPLTTEHDMAGFSAGEKAWIDEKLGQIRTPLPKPGLTIRMTTATRNRAVFMPSELVLRSADKTIKTSSVGLGAGRQYEEAAKTGLLEIIERDAAALWWYGGQVARRLDDRLISRSLLNLFSAAGRQKERAFSFLDITSDLNIPVYVCFSSDPHGHQIACGFGCDPTPQKALSAAFFEMCQMELAYSISLGRLHRSDENALSDVDRLLIQRSKTLSLKNNPQFQAGRSSQASVPPPGDHSLESLANRVRLQGFTPYFADLTRNDISIPVCRVIIPGLQLPDMQPITPRLQDARGRSGTPASHSSIEIAPF